MTEKLRNPHAGDILLEEFLEPYGLSQNALAKAIGVPANRINAIVKGTRGVSIDTDVRLCRYFSLSIGFFLRLQCGYEESMALEIAQKPDIKEITPRARMAKKSSRKEHTSTAESTACFAGTRSL